MCTLFHLRARIRQPSEQLNCFDGGGLPLPLALALALLILGLGWMAMGIDIWVCFVPLLLLFFIN